MKIRIVLCIAFCACSAAASANDRLQRISGSVWKSGHARAVFDLRVREGETQQAPLHGAESLEVSRSSKTGTSIRVLDPSGKPLASVSLDSEPGDRTVRFAFCESGGVEVSSPASEVAPRCASSGT